MCDGSEAVAKEALCTELGVVKVVSGTQCTCSKEEVFYVQGVEALEVAFSHSYKTSEEILGGITGTSARADLGLDTEMTFPNGTKRTYVAGETPVMTLAELISLNTNPLLPGIGLDTTNEWVENDARGDAYATNFPKFRASGLALTVDIKYSNLDEADIGGSVKLLEGNKNVDAELDVTAEAGWAGPGPQVFYSETPRTDSLGRVTYERMTRYGQGVVVVFRAAPSSQGQKRRIRRRRSWDVKRRKDLEEEPRS